MFVKGLQPTYKRQRFLLDFICQLSGGVTATDLQKLVFLCLMKEKFNFYEFIPYKFGPYSFQLASDVDILYRDQYLQRSDSRIYATKTCSYDISYMIPSERGASLIRKAYREYPYYTINSEILEKLFDEDEIAFFQSQRQKYIQEDQTLFTIGYEGKSIEAFINSLILNNVHVLCDVRRNPLSRKFGFSKNKLSHICNTVRIQYIHLPSLGVESNKRKSLNSVSDYENLFKDYAAKLEDLKPQLEYIHSLIYSKERVGLMCYEKDPKMCHRHVIRDCLVRTYEIRSVDL